MCGLIGLAGKNLTKNDSSMLYHLLHLDALRGEHSTGIATIKTNGDTTLYKELGPPFFLYKKYEKEFIGGQLPLQNINVVIGHNRYATQGKIEAETAHPFEMDSIVGAHNGTVYTYSLINFNGYKEYDIDSQIIFKHLSVVKDIQKVWDDANGAMALVWWDKENNTLNFARNKERPLYYALNKNGDTLYWASEPWMIRVASMRSGVELASEILSVDEDVHYTFSYGDKVEVVKTPLNPFVEKWKSGKHGYRGWGGEYTNHHNDNHSHRDNFKSKPFRTIGTYYQVEFFLDAWVSKVLTAGKTPFSGYFMGELTNSKELIKIHVRHVTPEIIEIIKALDNNDLFIIWNSKNAYMSYNQTLKKDILNVEWEEIELSDENFEKKELKTEEKENILIEGYQGEMLSKEEWEKRTKDGCAYCVTNLFWENRHKVIWIDRLTPYCGYCV